MTGSLLARQATLTTTPLPVAAARERVLEQLERTDNYPTLSDTAVRAVALAANPDVSISEVAALIRRDAVIAAALLRLANNWTHRGTSPVEEVLHAVMRVGVNECARLICSVGLKNLYAKCDKPTQSACEQLHKHAVFVACLSAELNRVAKLAFQGVEFTAGLLHDIGRLVACVKAPAAFSHADRLDFDEDDGDALLKREREHLGIDHCAIGYRFAEKNSLPETVSRVLLNHHRPGQEKLQVELVGLVAVADRVANYVQRSHSVVGYDVRACPGFKEVSALWNPTQKAQFCAALPAAVVRAIKDTRAMLKAVV